MLKKINKKYLIVVAILLVAGVFFFLRRQKSPTNPALKPTVAKLNTRTETTTPAVQSDLSETITLSGKIQAEKQTDAKFQTSGLLSWVGVKKGDFVKKGQALAQLDQTDIKKRLAKEMNDYLTNRSTFEDTQDQYKETRDRLLLTDSIKRILDRDQYSLNNAVLDVELADLTVRYSTIYSPIKGLVVAIDEPNSGVNITPATATFTIVDQTSLYFRCELAEDDISKIKVGTTATIHIDSYPNDTISSQISFISFSPVAGQSNTVYEVKFPLTVDNSNIKYRLGMNGDATIVLQSVANVIHIPIESVFHENNNSYVYVHEGNTKNKKLVTTGLESDTDIEIKTGLNAGELVVVPNN